MAVAVKVPAVGESVSEGVLSQWLKKDGDNVQVDDPLFELETDKATQAVPAPAAGILKIRVEEGATVTIGDMVAEIDSDAEAKQSKSDKDSDSVAKKSKSDKEQASPSKDEAEEETSSKSPATKNDRQQSEKKTDESTKAETTDEKQPQLMPSVRALVEENNLDPKQINGTGRDGRITKEDVLIFLEKQTKVPTSSPDVTAESQSPVPPATSENRKRMSAIRLRIAEKLVQSQQSTATLTTFNEVDMSAVMALRTKYKDSFKAKYGIGLGFMSFFVKACVDALQRFPLVNSRIEGNEIVTPESCHIGVAVSTEKGLMVPVLRQTETLSFAEIEQAIVDLATRARQGKITVDDLKGGTFTITNGGIFGSMMSTPILNPPQSGILGMHSIQKRAVVVDDEIVIRPMMYLALSYDHRLIDGREAVQFLVRIKDCIENPERLLLSI